MSSDDVFVQVEPAFVFYLGANLPTLPATRMEMEEHLDKTAGLVSNPSETLIWILGVPGFSDQTY